VVRGADTLCRFRARQLTGGCGAGALAMHPCRFHAIEPGTLARQLAEHQATAPGALDALMMSLNPAPYGAADRPGGLVPDDEERLCAVGGSAGRQPPETRGRDPADRPPVDKADQHGMGVCTQPALAGERCGLGIMPVHRVRHQVQGGTLRPGTQDGVGQAAPPDFIGAPSYPGWVRSGESSQAIPGGFLRAYCGSGLVIQCFARFQDAPRRLMARRTVSSLSCRAVKPCAWQTWAARASVHSPGGLPKVRRD